MTATDNLWQATATATIPDVRLQGAITADVVVIGAGYTGLSAALHLAERGADVCVLEARGIGHGGSGRNVGLVNAGLWTPPDSVEHILGPAEGKRLNAQLAEGPQRVFDLIRKHGIDCDATPNGTLHCAHSAAGFKDLKERHRQQVERGAPVKLLDPAQTIVRTGATGLHGALFDARAGTIQPLSYARGLARAASCAGATLFQNSPVIEIARKKARWSVKTPKGTVTAKHLIQATNAYGTGGTPRNNFTTMHYMQFATPVLPTSHRKSILSGGEGCWDTAKIMTSFRLSPDGRLLIGGIGNLGGFAGSQHRAWAARKLGSLFPHLSGVGFDYGWTGKVAVSGTYLPKITCTGPDALSIYGYSGRGIAPGTVFGQATADWVLSGDDSVLPLTLTAPKSSAFSGAKAFGYELGAALAHATAVWR